MKNKIGTKEKPLLLKTPPLSSGYTMHIDEKEGKEVLVCTVGKTGANGCCRTKTCRL